MDDSGGAGDSGSQHEEKLVFRKSNIISSRAAPC
jgi:hypothetical protein